MLETDQVMGVLLAGGSSRRMGRPKALLPWPPHDTLLSYHLAHLQHCASRLALAEGQHHFPVTGAASRLHRLPDPPGLTGQGPLAGMLAAMLAAADHLLPYCLIWSCDTALSTQQVRAQLNTAFDLLQRHPHVGAVYFKAERDYPLLGLYRSSLSALFHNYLIAGQRRVMPLLAQIQAISISFADSLEQLANINTQAEYEQALILQAAYLPMPEV